MIALAGRLPVTLWLGTQVLIVSTALFFGLLALLAGMGVVAMAGAAYGGLAMPWLGCARRGPLTGRGHAGRIAACPVFDPC